MTGSGRFKKAELIAEGVISIPFDLRLPRLLSCSRSGPDAGSYSIVLSFDGHRLKAPVSRGGQGRFSLTKGDEGYELLRNGRPFIDTVDIEPCEFHAPDQAFIDLNTGCILDCAFCTLSDVKMKSKLPEIEGVLNRIMEAGKSGRIKAIALTSGMGTNPSDAIEEMISAIKVLRSDLSLPIGVEPYVQDREQIDALYEAGADEIKLNIQSWNREIFRKVCPNWDYDETLSLIEDACHIFGKGMVASNIIFGLGETDEEVLQGVDGLAVLGCVASLRKLRINDLNRRNLFRALGSIPDTGGERILRLAHEHKKILERHDLDPRDFKTMCHACGCCDMVPFRDL